LLSSVTAYRHLYGHLFRNDGHLYGHLINCHARASTTYPDIIKEFKFIYKFTTIFTTK